MAIFPGAISSFAGFTSSHTLAADSHAAQHNSEQAEIVAAQTKIGTGSSTATASTVLRGTGAGTSSWGQVILTTDVTGVLPVANGGLGQGSLTGLTLPSAILPASPVLTTPTIADYTNATHTHASNAQGGTLNGASAITDGTITPAELMSGTGSSWVWQSYTPTVTLNGGTTNGNAVITGGYIQIGKIVHFWHKYVLGTTTNFSGLTSVTVTMPVTASTTWTNNNFASAFQAFIHPVTGNNFGCSFNQSTTTFDIVAYAAATAYLDAQNITSAVPGAWTATSSNYWMISGTYEAA